MDPEKLQPPDGGDEAPPPVPTCPCSCTCCGTGSVNSTTWRKRKLDDFESRVARALPLVISGGVDELGVARVEIENEVAALREALVSNQQSIHELNSELEEERSASASAATEAMSMILRLQREKAETQMEARQFKRFADEKMAHDQQEINVLEDLLYKREQTIQSLSCEVQAYRHRLLSFGISIHGEFPSSEPQTPDTATPNTVGAAAGVQFDFPSYDYPPLRCTMPSDDAPVDLDKYPFGETPREQLQQLEQRINHLERMPSSSHYSNVMEKRVVVGHSPHRPWHSRSFSIESYGSGLEFKRGEEFPAMFDQAPDHGGRDDMSDRVYTVDAVHGKTEDYVSAPREAQNKRDAAGGNEESEIRKLYMRLQALEADRESMRQTIISMGTDKAQVVLLKEIAQQLCKEVSPEKKIVKKVSPTKRFSFMAMIKVSYEIKSYLLLPK